jgi:glycosyltransferase involved in cell wall biosynthesis
MYGYRILLHHHSFAYITRPSALINAILAAGGKSLVHVFLGKDMERGFRETYAARRIEGMVLSNAAFVPPCAINETMADGPLVLGHLSNLTKEKGLHIFLDLLRAAVAKGVPVRGILAGPAAKPADRELIERARKDLDGRLEYRGPLYGGEKDAFYRDIDVFVFPTQYIHEAQPTVLFEAQAAGCKIISFDRGCILEQVQQDGLVMSQGSDFVAESLDWLRANGGVVRSDRAKVGARYAARHSSARKMAESLFAAAFETDCDASSAAARS